MVSLWSLKFTISFTTRALLLDYYFLPLLPSQPHYRRLSILFHPRETVYLLTQSWTSDLSSKCFCQALWLHLFTPLIYRPRTTLRRKGEGTVGPFVPGVRSPLPPFSLRPPLSLDHRSTDPLTVLVVLRRLLCRNSWANAEYRNLPLGQGNTSDMSHRESSTPSIRRMVHLS